MWGAPRLLATQSGRQALDRSIEIHVRSTAFKQVQQMFAQRLIVFHSFTPTHYRLPKTQPASTPLNQKKECLIVLTRACRPADAKMLELF